MRYRVLYVFPALALLGGACEESSGSGPATLPDAGTFDTGSGDASPTPDSGVDSGTDAGGDSGTDAGDAAATFSPKASCDAPASLTAYAGNEFGARLALASAPGAPVTLLSNRVVLGQPFSDCELRTFGGAAPGSWTGAATLRAADCTAVMPWHISAGGAAAIALWHTPSLNARRRVTSASSTDVGTAGVDNEPDNSIIKVGSGGHALQLFRSNTGVAALFIDAAGNVTALPENTLAVGVDGMTAALDATGAGYAFWTTTGTDLNARRFAAGAWTGPAASYTPGDAFSGKLSATILPNGDAYVAYSFVNAGQGIRGIRVSSSNGAITFGTTDDLALGKAIVKLASLAAADGETTVLYSESDGVGTITTSARRGTPKAFGGAATLGADPGEYMSASIDATGHVTMLRNTSALDGALHHHRIAHGGTTWTAAKRIDAAAGNGTVGNYTAVAHLPNGDPIAVWQDTKDLKYTICH